jgi:hypothetical protein
MLRPYYYILFYKRSVAQFSQGLLNLLERVHHEGTIRDDRFPERCASHEHEAHGIVLCLDLDAIAIREFEKLYRLDGLPRKDSFALENIGERGVSAGDGLSPFFIGTKLKVQVKRRSSDLSHGALHTFHFTRDEADLDPILFVCGNAGCAHFLIARFGHLEMGGKVDPQLKAVDRSLGTAARHFLMQDAATGGHPLHIAGTDQARVAEAVAVMCGAFQHICDGLDAAMGMHGEAADRTLEGIVEGKMVEEQEGVEFVAGARRNGAAQFDARAFDGSLGFDNFGNTSKVIHACIDEVREESITPLL